MTDAVSPLLRSSVSYWSGCISWVVIKKCSADSGAVKHKSHPGFSTEWQCLQETLLVRMRVLFPCLYDGWWLSLLPSPCCCKEADFMLQLWPVLALRHTECSSTIYITGTTPPKDKTHVTLVYWLLSGLSLLSHINVHCWKFRTWPSVVLTHLLLPWGNSCKKDLSCQCALLTVYLTSCWSPCFLCGWQSSPGSQATCAQPGIPRAAGPAHGLSISAARCCLELETNALLICPGEFQKVAAMGRQALNRSRKAWSRKLAKQSSSREANLHLSPSSRVHAQWRSKSLYHNVDAGPCIIQWERSTMFWITGL